MSGATHPGARDPRIVIDKPASLPVLFLDTYIWHAVLTSWEQERDLLRASCSRRAIIVAVPSVARGELRQRGLLLPLEELCGSCVTFVPVGRISANQVIGSLASFISSKRDVVLRWGLATSEVPILKHPEGNLRHAVQMVAEQLNRLQRHLDASKEQLVGYIARIERDVWKAALEPYQDCFIERYSDTPHGEKQIRCRYDEFFTTSYFLDLPFLVITSYLLGYLLGERPLRINDVIDVYCVAELLPYAILVIVDKDVHNRLRRLQKDCPPLFRKLDEICCLSSAFPDVVRQPRVALRKTLESV